MSFPDDLLEQAYDLARKESTNPKQASLRRAISTAYYALFHLLVDEAVSKWAVERQRSILARTFDHGKMKGICDDVLKTFKSGGNVPPELNTVSQNFIQLQQHRHTADYDNSRQWSRTEVLNVLNLATTAFSAWRTISGQDAAQDYLLQLFLRGRPDRNRHEQRHAVSEYCRPEPELIAAVPSAAPTAVPAKNSAGSSAPPLRGSPVLTKARP